MEGETVCNVDFGMNKFCKRDSIEGGTLLLEEQ